MSIHRRDVLGGAAVAAASCVASRPASCMASSLAAWCQPAVASDDDRPSSQSWTTMVASCMYGTEPLERILPELKKLNCDQIDLWPRVHGSQREEVDQLGEEAFLELLKPFKIRVACLSQYALGLFGLEDEIPLAARLGCPRIVVHFGGKPQGNLDAAKRQIDLQWSKSQKVFDHAKDHGIRICIENHSGTMLSSVDAIDHFLGVMDHAAARFAFAPAHLPQDPEQIASVATSAGSKLEIVYAWQYGKGFRAKMAREDEWLQLPGRGSLDFGPLMRGLTKMKFGGVIETMMHPTPRGVPIADNVAAVTRLIHQSHQYLQQKADVR